MLVLTPTAIHSGYVYPMTPSTNYPQHHYSCPCPHSYSPFSSNDNAVDLAAYEYAVAHARAEALREERARAQAYACQQAEQEQIRLYLEARKSKEALRRAREQEQLLQTIFAQQSSRRRLPYDYSSHVTYPTYEEVIAYRQQQELARRREAVFLTQRRQREEEQRHAAFLSLFGLVTSSLPEKKHEPTTVNVDKKGKARETPAIPLTTSRSASTSIPKPVKQSNLSKTSQQVYEAFAQEQLAALFGVNIASQEQKPISKAAEKTPVAPSSKPQDPSAVPSSSKVEKPIAEDRSLQDLLAERVMDEDVEIQETAFNLIKELYGITGNTTADVKGKGKARAEPSSFKVEIPSPVKEYQSRADLKRTSDITPLHDGEAEEVREILRERHPEVISTTHTGTKTALDQIDTIASDLQKLESNFTFPSELDFVPSTPATPIAPTPSTEGDTFTPEPDAETASQHELAYTSRNRPLREYEHALGALLEKLDAVDSQGDESVRGRRREVVKKVERALGEVERAVRESREKSESRSRSQSVERAVAETQMVEEPLVEDVSLVVPEVEATPETAPETPEAEVVADVAETTSAPIPALVENPAASDSESALALAEAVTKDSPITSIDIGVEEAPAESNATVEAISGVSAVEEPTSLPEESATVTVESSILEEVASSAAAEVEQVTDKPSGNTFTQDTFIGTENAAHIEVVETVPTADNVPVISTLAAVTEVTTSLVDNATEEPSQDTTVLPTMDVSTSNSTTEEPSQDTVIASDAATTDVESTIASASALEQQPTPSPNQTPLQVPQTPSFLLQPGSSPFVDPEQKTPAYTDAASDVSSAYDISESELDSDVEVLEHDQPEGDVKVEADVKSEDGWDVVG